MPFYVGRRRQPRSVRLRNLASTLGVGYHASFLVTQTGAQISRLHLMLPLFLLSLLTGAGSLRLNTPQCTDTV